jgi:hypothetical protein
MTEWWTYRPSDFLLFAPRTYYRLIELYNAELWPAHLVVLAAILAMLVIAWHGGRHAGRIVAALLALSWAFIAWGFHWRHYATINWAAVWFAAAFALQAVLLAGAALNDALSFGGATRARRYAGLTIVVIALAVEPLTGLALRRPWTQLELAGLAPDPTALLTLGLLVAARRAPWWLYPVPLLWCIVTGMTLWTMEAPDAFVPLLAALVAAAAVASYRLRGG